jgi:hypothetical protein
MRILEVIVYIGLLGTLGTVTALACAVIGTYARNRSAKPER